MNKNMQHKIHNMGRSSDFIIRIKSGSGLSIEGKVEHIHSGGVQYFKDYLELILMVQSKLDEIGSPQCDTELRCYTENKLLEELHDSFKR